jgi:hypothetical protein
MSGERRRGEGVIRGAKRCEILACVGSRGVASYRAPHQKTVCLRRHPIDLETRNATPIRWAAVARHLLGLPPSHFFVIPH